MRQRNISIEMVICVAVDCKSDSRQGKAKVPKSKTAMTYKNKT